MDRDSRYRWIAVIERSPPFPTHSHAVLWRTLQFEDVVYPSGSPLRLVGKITPDLLASFTVVFEEADTLVNIFETEHGRHRELSWLREAMHHAYQRLSFPASFRDLVRQLAHFRRYTLYVHAWFQWHIAIMDEGKIIAMGTLEQLLALRDQTREVARPHGLQELFIQLTGKTLRD